MPKNNEIIIEKLLNLKNRIEKLTFEYDSIVKIFGHDIYKCSHCGGTGIFEKFIGNDCNGSNYDYEKCGCFKGYRLKERLKNE